MKKTLKWISILGVLIFLLCYQSLLVNRNVSNIPFTPNIFVSSSSVKKTSFFVESFDYMHNAYSRKLNDSIESYHMIYERVSLNHKVTGAMWKVKYKNMNAKNLLNYLDASDLFLFTSLNDTEDLYTKKKMIFKNKQINQYLIGSFDKTDSCYYLNYDYPNDYTPYKDQHSFKKNFKDIMIGSPR
ncbi:hypothetical protein [Tenacibaculum finnmarkense]|uniref:hypothetical protein n=1 Tax=Tenacibaculum finnmarkense TaxID=2781243 RepID=UPI00187B2D8B|nr:hypothetical protein [Tenacibaculum finnmarkense]MBE7661039.1 hypothetical protein [Tenacibaculum finnmarkense genomovar finnmarkense]MCG8252717.1 hypothetical protein [Tenacibaculum finnmarkense genomovar finnmarkense]MCG8816239.1 hypothetical protein [Tenacibaculum finnmarkense]MCG8821205.1 hypothetical protein [Tenacibaculum finnmarkense]